MHVSVHTVGCDHIFDIVLGDCVCVIHVYMLHYAFAAFKSTTRQFCCLNLSVVISALLLNTHVVCGVQIKERVPHTGIFHLQKLLAWKFNITVS